MALIGAAVNLANALRYGPEQEPETENVQIGLRVLQDCMREQPGRASAIDGLVEVRRR